MNDVKKIYKNVIILFLLSLLYSILRYNIFKGIAWSQLPLFIVNKAVSLSAVLLMATSLFAGRKISVDERYKELAMRYGWAGFQFIVVHTLLSLILLNPGYYEKFYQTGRLTFKAELFLLFGVMAFVLLVIYSINAALQRWGVEPFHPGVANSSIRTAAVIFIAGHLFVMGFNGWFNIAYWPGSLPPITLIAFIVIFIILSAGFIKRYKI